MIISHDNHRFTKIGRIFIVNIFLNNFSSWFSNFWALDTLSDFQLENHKFLENKLSQITYDDVKWNENKAFWSKKKIRGTLDQIGLGDLWIKAHYMDSGIVDTMRQRLKDIELQHWMSEMNNDIRRDANENIKWEYIENYKL